MANSKPASDADAIALLKADHQQVKRLLRDFAAIKGESDQDERKARLVDELCDALTIHTRIEEELFYPAVRAAIDDNDLMDEAEVEHAGARDLISQLAVMYPGDDHYDATVTVLGEEVEHHIEEEENEMFPKVRKAGIDLVTLGRQLAQRKEELDDDLAAPPAGTPAKGARSARKPQRPPS